MQLDEFQLPLRENARLGRSPLYHISKEFRVRYGWEDFREDLKMRVGGNSLLSAIPFYDNFSLMAYRSDLRHNMDAPNMSDWFELVRQCRDWEYNNPEGIFFDFPRSRPENYNCLFFEILWALTNKTIPKPSCRLRSWLRSEEAAQAGVIYNHLCHQTCSLSSINTNLSSLLPIAVDTKAQVWRHWYSTLNQMLTQMKPEDCALIELTSLPGVTSTAGEWYLGIPKHSATPEEALRLIERFTTPSEELTRLRMGIGLPTRQFFYDQLKSNAEKCLPDDRILLSHYVEINPAELQKILESRFRRSTFTCYQDVSSLITDHLKLITQVLPPGHYEEKPLSGKHYVEMVLESPYGYQVRKILDSLLDMLDYVLPSECHRCKQVEKFS